MVADVPVCVGPLEEHNSSLGLYYCSGSDRTVGDAALGSLDCPSIRSCYNR